MNTLFSCSANVEARPSAGHRPRMPLLELALSIATAMGVSACGGGGGGGGNMVQASAPPGIVVELGSGQTRTIANETHTESLSLQGSGTLTLQGSNRYGSTTVSGGTLVVDGQLTSNVSVATGAKLMLDGDVIGNVAIDGMFEPVTDEETSGGWYYETYTTIDHAQIAGEYRQTGTGTLRAILGAPAEYSTPLLAVGGAAVLAGTLELGTNYFTDEAYTAWLIHANGGISGRFGTTTAPGLFLVGNLRYGTHDLYYDVVRASILQAVESLGVSDTITLASAASLERAFAFADDFAALPRADLAVEQRQFLRSAAAIQRIQTTAQAAATLDSLSGLAHAQAPWLLLEHATRPAPQLSARLDGVQHGARAGAWTARPRTGGQAEAGGMGVGYSVDGQVAGYDQWLGERVLLGSSFGWRNTRMQFDRSGGQARDEGRQASLYLRYQGDDGAYAFGQAGVDQSRLTLDRQIDLAAGSRHRAYSQRDLDLSHVYAEAGRAFAVGQGRLVPYAALAYAALHSDAVVEQGDTGLELALQSWRSERITADAGLRYARQWRVGDGSWLRLDLDARYAHALRGSDTPLQAAFVGAPLAPFDIDGSAASGGGWLGIGLDGGGQHGWAWFLDYGRGWSGPQRGAGWALGMKRDF